MHSGWKRPWYFKAVWLFGAAAATAFGAAPAQAQISFVDMFRNNSSTQTANGNSLSAAGSFLSLDLVSINANDFNTAQATYSGPASPLSLPQATPTTFHYQTGSYPTQAAMDADFPTGTYTFAANGNAGPNSTSFDYTDDRYPTAMPFLEGTDFADLQGMNAASPFTFHISPFGTHSGVDSAFIFLTIFDTTANAFVYDAGFLPITTTSVTLPANTLEPGHSFLYEVDFSDRELTPSPGAQFDAQIGFDVRTSGRFNSAAAAAAVPEPGVAPLAGAAVLALCVGGLLRRRTA